MGENNEQKFDIETVLSITTGRKFTDMANINKLLCFLTGMQLSPFELTKAREVAKDYILETYPQLKDLDKDLNVVTPGDATHFIDEQKMIFGNVFALSPLPEGSYTKQSEEELVKEFANLMKEELTEQVSKLEQNN